MIQDAEYASHTVGCATHWGRVPGSGGHALVWKAAWTSREIYFLCERCCEHRNPLTLAMPTNPITTAQTNGIATPTRTQAADAETKATPSTLLPFATRAQQLAEHLSTSGLLPEDCTGWECVSAADAARLLGRDGAVSGNCIRIPYYTLEGAPLLVNELPFNRLRLLSDRDQKTLGAKYLSPGSSGAHVFIPNGFRTLLEAVTPGAPAALVLTEGEKKAVAAVKSGVLCLGIPGVRMGISEGALVPELAALIEQYKTQAGVNARVVVLYDSEGALLPPDAAVPQGKKAGRVQLRGVARATGHREVAQAGLDLVAAVRGVGVAAAYTACPAGEGGAKVGIDDLYVQQGAAAVLELVQEAATHCTDVDEEAEAEVAAILADLPFTPLGTAPDGSTLHLRMRATGDIVTLPTRDLTLARLTALFGSSWVEGRFVDVTEQGRRVFSGLEAGLFFGGLCQRCGIWSEDRRRGAGAWCDADGTVLLNAHEGLIDARTGETLSQDDRVRSGVLYDVVRESDRVGMSVAAILHAPEQSPAEALLQHLQSWGYATTTAPYLLAAWVSVAALLPALPIRPHVWVYGRAGSGKTSLAESITAAMDRGCIAIDGGATAHTPAGLRQSIGAASLPVVFDEAEVHSSSDPRLIERARAVVSWALSQARAGYTSSGDGANTIGSSRGTPSGRALVSQAVTPWCWLSISPPELQEADRGRLVLLEMDVAKRVGSAPPSIDLAERLGAQARAWMLRHLSALEAALGWVHEDPQAAALVSSGRLRSTWGLFAAAWCVLQDGSDWAAHQAETLELLTRIRDDQSDGGGEIESMGTRLLRDILTLRIQVGDGMGRVERTVGELLTEVEPAARGQADTAAGRALRDNGVVLLSERQLFVAGALSVLRDRLGRSGWAAVDVDKVLGQLPGAERAGQGNSCQHPRQRVAGGVRMSGVVLPMPADLVHAPGVEGA